MNHAGVGALMLMVVMLLLLWWIGGDHDGDK